MEIFLHKSLNYAITGCPNRADLVLAYSCSFWLGEKISLGQKLFFSENPMIQVNLTVAVMRHALMQRLKHI